MVVFSNFDIPSGHFWGKQLLMSYIKLYLASSLCLSHCKSMGVNVPQGVGHFWPMGHDSRDLCKDPHNNAAYQI